MLLFWWLWVFWIFSQDRRYKAAKMLFACAINCTANASSAVELPWHAPFTLSLYDTLLKCSKGGLAPCASHTNILVYKKDLVLSCVLLWCSTNAPFVQDPAPAADFRYQVNAQGEWTMFGRMQVVPKFILPLNVMMSLNWIGGGIASHLWNLALCNCPQLSTVNYQLSTINYQLSTLNSQLSTLNSPLLALSS